MRLFPCFARAMFRRAVVLLELGDTYRSCEAFEDLYRLDRNWPRLDDWLVRSNALHKRATKGKKKSGKHKAGYFDEAFDQSNQSESQNHQKEHSIVDETNHYKGTPFITFYLISSHFISSHRNTFYLISSHYISSHRNTFYLGSSHYILSYYMSSHLIALHRITSHLITCHNTHLKKFLV